MFKLISLTLFLAFTSHSLHASTANNELEQAFKKIGETTFSILFWDLYKSKLLTSSGQYPLAHANDKLLYEITYLKSISSADLIKRTIEQWQHIGVPEKNYQAYLPVLKKIWPDISPGDTLSLVVHDGSSTFYYNKKRVGIINSAAFGPTFLDIWLAQNTSQPKLRDELLGTVNHG